MGAQYSKFIKSTLYSPATMYGMWTKNHFSHHTPQPLIATPVPSKDQLKNVPFVPCRCGNVPKGCVLSYQQRISTDYVINDFTCTAFPELPLDNSEKRFENNCSICLDNKQQAAFEALSVTRNASLKVQEQTITESSSSIWYLLRKKRITATKFGLVAKRVSNFDSLVAELNPSRYVQSNAIKRGLNLRHMQPWFKHIQQRGDV